MCNVCLVNGYYTNITHQWQTQGVMNYKLHFTVDTNHNDPSVVLRPN